LHVGQVAGLAAGAAKTVNGVLYLPEGDYDASVAVDAQGQVAESNEGNNGATVRLKVRNCGGPGNGH
jgi:subtilase family serine protease